MSSIMCLLNWSLKDFIQQHNKYAQYTKIYDTFIFFTINVI